MRIVDAFELLAWPLDVARSAGAELGARVDPIARLVSRRLGRGRRAQANDGDDRAVPPPSDLRDRAESARFWLGSSRPAPSPAVVGGALVDPEPGELPAAYGVDRAVLVPRDPWWIFVFWEISSATREAALGALGSDAHDACPMLRIYDVTFVDPRGSNAALSFDVEVPRGTESWYVNVGRPAATYCAEIGLRTSSGHFLPLLRSNAAATPRATPAADREVRWLEFGPTGPAWSADQRPPRPGAVTPPGDELLAPGN
jgi:hypothetical protein